MSQGHDPVARAVLVFAQHDRGDRLAVDGDTFRQFRAGQFTEGREQIGEVGQGVRFDAGRHQAGAVDDVGLADAVLGQLRFAAADQATVHAARDTATGAVVGGPDDDGVVANLQLVNRRNEPAQSCVGVADHRLVFGHLVGSVRFGRSAYQRAVRQGHGKVQHHGLVLMPLDEVDQEVNKYVAAKSAFVGSAAFVGVDVRVPIASAARRIARLVTGPHAPLVEPVFAHGIGRDSEVVDLPLAGSRCCIAGFLQLTGKRSVAFPIEMASGAPARHIPVVAPTVSPRVLPREQRRARGRALGHRVGIVELHAPGRQGVQVGRFDLFGSVARDPFFAQVVDHDEQNVRPIAGLAG